MSGGRCRWLALGMRLLALGAGGCLARRDAPPPVPSTCPSAAARPTPAAAPPTEQPFPAPSPTPRPRHVVLLGDSTTWGTPQKQSEIRKKVALQSPYEPARSLEALLALEPPRSEGGTPWHNARVHNLAVAASTSQLWVADPPRFCETVYGKYPVVANACRKNVPWVNGVPLTVDGAEIDAVIVDLGINDSQVTSDPKETVARLVQIAKALAPAPVLFFPPIAPPDGPRGAWPQEVRAEMIRQGLFDEEQYPAYLPTYDGLHPTDGGYAAKAALWLDALRKLP